MAMELLCDVKGRLGILLNGKNGCVKNGRGHEELEKKLAFNFPTLHANIQEAEAMSLTPMERGSDEWTRMLAKFLELKEFVYEVEDHLDKLRIETLISQERGNDLIARVSSMTLRRQGRQPQPEPDEQENKHLMTRGYKKVRNFFFSRWHRKFGLNLSDLESKLNSNFSWINEIPPARNFTATRNSTSSEVPKVVGRDEDKISVINLLESDDDQQSPQGLPVISIVGPVGIGKSTPPEHITSEDKVRELFPIQMWDADGYVRHDLCQRVESGYSSLPKHLKLCFKYFSLIPKGYWIEKEVLTQLWMAEGFINPEEEGTAEKCFDELLLETSFFKDIEKDEDGNIVRCKIHEPLHDIICHLSEDEFSVITEGLPSKPDHSLHSSLRCINNMRTVDSYNAKKMRTLLCFESPRNLKVLSDLFLQLSSHLKLLRVLDLSLSIIEELPHSISKLEHLRFLNLSHTQIKMLPAFICNLYLLRTLKLSHSLLSELPRETWKLQKLRHLEIDGTPMNHLPPWIGRLSNLQLLSEFIVSGDGGRSIEELANLEHLQGRLIISHLNRVLDQKDAQTAINTKDRIKHLILDGEKHLSSQNLRHKKHFNSLLLEHMCKEAEFKYDDDSEIKRVERVFESINPHSGLKRLEVWNYFGSKVPKWLAASFSGLVSLKLAKWLKMDHMPHLGTLPSLKFLHIYDMAKVRSIDTCDLEGFPKLEQLTLEEMPEWEEWNLELPEGHLPCFLELIVSNCPKLKNLPALPQTLRKLEIHDCKEIGWNDGFPPLPNLEYLVLKGKVGNLCSLPNAPKLVSMTVALSPDLASFPNGFDKLKSLSALNIHFCPRLQSLPKELKQLNNLKRLHIAGCRLLKKEWLNNKVLPSGCSYDDDDDIRNGKGEDYDYRDRGNVEEDAYDDDNSDGEDEDD